MRRVARHTAFVCLDRCVLKDERSHRIGVALGADGELSRCGADLVPDLRAVWIVTVTALHQPDINAVTVRTCELSFLAGVTAEAQCSLRFYEHEIHIGGFVWTMA